MALASCERNELYDIADQAINNQETDVTGVKLNKSTTYILLGSNEQLFATVSPSSSVNQNVFWSSSNDFIASVDASGIVTAVLEGTAVITVTTEEGGFTAQCSVTVSATPVPVTGVTVTPSSLSLLAGATVNLSAAILPSNATNQNISWSSANGTIATVNSAGVVTGQSPGVVTITATTQDGSFTDQCEVTVSENGPPVPGGSGLIVTSDKTDTSIQLSWTAAVDNFTPQADLEYAVCRSSSANISSVSGCEGALIIMNYTKNQTGFNATGLTPSTTYYFNVVVRDASDNAAVYVMKSDATTATPVLPSVSTTPIVGNFTYAKLISGVTAGAGGHVTSDGGAAVTERGVCWSTAPDPKVGTDSCVKSGSGTGAFDDVVMTGLTSNGSYFVRAYAVNSAGTAYGISVKFNSGYPLGTGHGGGYIFYNDGEGGGMVAAPTDLSKQAWITGGTTQTTSLGSTQTSFGSGKSNSDAIAGMSGHFTSAADACLTHWDGMYGDWYLPSKDELQRMWEVLADTPGKRSTYGFTDFDYWSSSEVDASNAWTLYFSAWGWNPDFKSNSDVSVRPVRTFIP